MLYPEGNTKVIISHLHDFIVNLVRVNYKKHAQLYCKWYHLIVTNHPIETRLQKTGACRTVNPEQVKLPLQREGGWTRKLEYQ